MKRFRTNTDVLHFYVSERTHVGRQTERENRSKAPGFMQAKLAACRYVEPAKKFRAIQMFHEGARAPPNSATPQTLQRKAFNWIRPTATTNHSVRF